MQKHIIQFLLVSVLSFAFVWPCFATTGFSYQKAQSTLEQVKKSLSNPKINVLGLQNEIQILNQIEDGVQACIASSKRRLEKLQSLNQHFTASTPSNAKKSQAFQHFQAQWKQAHKQHAECQLIELQIQNIRELNAQLSLSHIQTELFDLGPRFKFYILDLPSEIKLIATQLFSKQWLRAMGFSTIGLGFSIFILLMLLAGYILGKKISALLLKPSVQFETHHAILKTCARYAQPICIMVALSLTFTIQNIFIQSFEAMSLIAYLITLTLFAFLVIELIFSYSKTLSERSKILISLINLGFIFHIATLPLQFSSENIIFLRIFYMSAIALSLFRFSHVALEHSKICQEKILIKHISHSLLFSFVGVLITCEWLGYHHLSFYLFYNSILTLLCALLFWLIQKCFMELLNHIEWHEGDWQQRFRRRLGFKKKCPLPEFYLLRIVLRIFVALLAIYTFSNIWAYNTKFSNQIEELILLGIPIANIQLYPIKLLIGSVIFVSLSLLTRMLRTHLAVHDKRIYEHGSKNALSSIISYIGFSIATIVSLVASGINLSGLTLIAGALSVGVGFGLQTIANNFISGIALLLEQPLKIGDLIDINGVEGYIKSIQMRYTVIRTLQHTDLIVPNSELITKQVNNLMCQDHYKGIVIQVGVAYGTDTDIVKRLLLQVAKDHPEVTDKLVSDVANELYTSPMALMTEIGESTYNFELRCLVVDANRKQFVISDLYQQIEKILTEHSIEIAFPQRDIHLFYGDAHDRC